MFEERTCALPGCGEPYTPTRGNQRYHNRECAREALALSKRGPRLEDRICEHCGDTFTPKTANQRYCKPSERRNEETKRKRTSVHPITGAPVATTRHIPTASEGERLLIWGDQHIPFQDMRTLRAVEGFARDFKPNVVVYMGDFFDCFELSRFTKSPLKRTTWGDDLRSGRAILANQRRLFKDARVLWLDGNHEYNVWRYNAAQAPALADILDPLTLFGLRDLDIEYLPFGSSVSYLSYRIEHGCFVRKWSAYSARAERERHGTSGCSGHTHRRGMHCWRDERGTHTWHEIGCLCQLNPDWLPNADWQQGFAYGVAHKGKVHITAPAVYSDGLRAEGKFYPR